MKHVKNGTVYLIPASTETRGHSTTANARFYSDRLRDFLAAAPQRSE
jgi:homoserine O-acetyltransferase